MNRHFLALLVIFGVVATSCGDDAPESLTGPAAVIYPGDCADRTGANVVIYSGRSENLMSPVLDAFQCESGIDVEVQWGSSTDLALLVEADGSRSDADVFLSQSPGPVGFLESKDLLAPIDDSVLNLVGEENRSDASTWVGFSGRKRVLVYNVDDLSIDELPDSVFDLTDERWAGVVGIPASNGSFIDWMTVFRDVYGDEVVAEWLDAMVANGAKVYDNNRSVVDAASRGEIEVGLVNHYYNYQQAAANGDEHRAANHDFADDDIGSLLIITAATVLKSSDVPDEANELVAYLLSAPVQRYFADETFEYPLAAGVAPNSVLPPLSALEIGTVNFSDLGGFAGTTDLIAASGILDS